MLCLYHNESKNMNPNHVENHDRIDIPIKYLYNKFKNKFQMYNNHTINKYLLKLTNISDIEIIGLIFMRSVYSRTYLKDIKDMCKELKDDEIIEGDTYFSKLTYTEIINNANILYNVCYQISNNKIKYAYCLIRPPSHHSTKNKFSGFCLVNMTFLTAKKFHDIYKKRVFILDYDLHHGDGTQDLVKKHENDNIYFCSMHHYAPNFFPRTGSIKENTDKVLNIPFEKNLKDEDYIKEFNEQVKDFIQKSQPDIIIISNGVDAHEFDPMKKMKLTNYFYVYVTEYLKSLDLPLIYILEGGYSPNIITNVSEEIINVLINK
jgi:acetoin utilization deacetylase AcuC-like enzyme